MKIRMILFFIYFLIWTLLSWPFDSEHALIGIVVSIFVTFVTGDIFTHSPAIFKRPLRYLWFLYYIPVFLWECFKANLDGAWRVIHPDLPIRPGIVKVKTTLKSDTGLTFLANTLTLKPGTMTVDIDRQNGFLYVHWSIVRTQDVDKATEMVVAKFERILKRIFD
ncbi:MAG: Na+/H+ antiporter subunit E [Candidatus Omnitrophota bacterium]